MKQYYVASLCREGILGGGIVSDEDGITYKTGKVTVSPKLRNLEMKYRDIQDYVSIGRVIAVKRRSGIGTQVLSEGIRAAKEYFAADKIYLEAQVYAKSFYEKLGFRQVSDEFLEDGIPHIKMIREADA